MRRVSVRQAFILVATLIAPAAVVLLALRQPADDAATAREPAAPPPIVSARFVCSFTNADAARYSVAGADGGQSVVAGGRSYWLFGDTLFTGASGKQIEANSIAWSDGPADGGCPALTYYANDGIAIPFLQKDGSLTVWPSGAIANDDGTIDVYTVYIYGSGPWAYWTGEVGIARLDPATMRVETTARSLFDAESGFRSQIIAAQPVDEDGDGRLRVVLQAQDGAKLLARVPRSRVQDAAAYQYWDGERWTADPRAAAALWTVAPAAGPVAALASFEGSTQVAWSAAFDAYVAVMNAGHASIGVRFAERLEGPWSDIVPWLDCAAVAEPRVPVCYAPALHPQLSRDGSLFVTFTRFGEYDVVAYELTPGAPVHEYRDGDTIVYGFEPPEGDWEDLGIAFGAARAPSDGLVPVYRWRRDGEFAFAATAPGDGFVREDVAFYAAGAPSEPRSPLRLRPVYAWSDGTSHLLSTMDSGLERYGFARGEIAFYAP